MEWTKAVLGGDTTNFLELHRYCYRSGSQHRGSHWTDWLTDSRESASRLTGVPRELIAFRLSVRVNVSALNQYFEDHGTKYVPGEGSGIEYRSLAPIDQQYIEARRMTR